MKLLLFTVILLSAIYLVSYLLNSKKYVRIDIFSKEETIILKGIGIVLVIVSHIGGICGTRIATPLGGIGVAIFLFLSGFGLSKSRQKNVNLESYWKKKIKNILFPYILIQLVAYLFNLIEYNDTVSFILDILLINPQHPNGWYMRCIFIYYLLFYFCFKIVKKKQENIFYVLSFVLAIILLLLRWEIYFEQAISFGLGVYIGTKQDFNFINKKLVVITFATGIIFLCLKQVPVVRETFLIYNICQLFIKLPIAISIICLVSLLIKHYTFYPFFIIGRNSYMLYLVHIYILILLRNILSVNVFFIIVYIMILGIIIALSESLKIKRGLKT